MPSLGDPAAGAIVPVTAAGLAGCVLCLKQRICHASGTPFA